MKTILLFALFVSTGCTTEQVDKREWKVKATTENEQKIWVMKADGSRQCEKKAVQPLSPKKAALDLQAAGIPVFASQAGQDGKMHSQRCGAPTGGTVELQISRGDLTKALAQGYVTKAQE